MRGGLCVLCVLCVAPWRNHGRTGRARPGAASPVLSAYVAGRRELWLVADLGAPVSHTCFSGGYRCSLQNFWCPNKSLLSYSSSVAEGQVVRAALHYGGEVHESVKNFSPRHGYLRQRMVCQRRWHINKYFIQVGVLRRSNFLYEPLRMPKKLDLQRNPLQKSVAMFLMISFEDIIFIICIDYLTQQRRASLKEI